MTRFTVTRIDDTVAAAVEHGQAPGIVAAVSCGDDMHLATAGEATVGGAPRRRDTIFVSPRSPSR